MIFDYKFTYSSLQLSSDDFSGIFSNEEEAEMLSDELNLVIDQGEEWIKPFGKVLLTDGVDIGITDLGVRNVRFECGRKIARLMKGSEQVALFVCTIGAGISDAYKYFISQGDPLKAYFVDTLGSIAVEKAMDLVQHQLAEELSARQLQFTNRFSPGYCGWPVREQQKIFSFFPSSPCGISLSESSLMIPSKSVSGIIGVGHSVRYVEHNCMLCEMKNCLYRKKLHQRE